MCDTKNIAYQAIETRYAGPTNYTGSRIIATTASGKRIIVEWDNRLGIEDNHIQAARTLALNLDWGHLFPHVITASTKKGYVHVACPHKD